MDIVSPNHERATKQLHQEKGLRKRRELDALVKDFSGGRKKKRLSANEELLYKDESSSDSGEGRVHEGVGVTVWRSSKASSHFKIWWSLKWALCIGTVVLLSTITVWLQLSTRFELDLVRKHLVRGEYVYRLESLYFTTPIATKQKYRGFC